MAEDPIENIKRKLLDTQTLFEDLRVFIQQSNQQQAASKVREIEQKLDSVKTSLRNEFGWLSPRIED